MATSAIAAHLAKPFVKDGATYVEIAGIRVVKFDPSKKDVDTTDFNSAGWSKTLVTSRGLTIKLEGQGHWDAGTQDSGQARVEELANGIGTAAVGEFYIEHPDGTNGIYFSANVSLTDKGIGGTVEDVSPWGCELVVLDEPTTAVLPS